MYLKSILSLSFVLVTFFIPQLYCQEIQYIPTNDQQLKTFSILNAGFEGEQVIFIDGEMEKIDFSNGNGQFKLATNRKGKLHTIQFPENNPKLVHISNRRNGAVRIRNIPLWMSILPPLIAITMALIFKEVIVSLFLGIWVGSFIAGGFRFDSFFYFLYSFFEVISHYIVNALSDPGHVSVIVFSLLIGGMVAVVSRNGGMAGIVNRLSYYARNEKSTQIVTWLLGIAIFFDDYANTLIVGNTMRPVTDKFKVSREKLAYLVDSTAAPVASVAFITTWIGAELGYIDTGITQLTDYPYEHSPYAIFIHSLKYSFYPILTLIFIYMLIRTGKDFGPMLKAERRARTTGQVSPAATPDEDEPNMEDLSPVPGAPLKWWHAAVPVIMVILVSILGLISTGMDSLYQELLAANVSGLQESWGSIWANAGVLIEGSGGFFRKMGLLIGAADSFVALLWASVSGATAAIIITLAERIMKLGDTMFTLGTGIKTMIPAILILTLAWSLAITTEELQTATFLSSALEGNINPRLIPALIFVLSAFTSFSTGSSWSTMAILYPIAIPTTWIVSQSAGIAPDEGHELMLIVISVVLGASVLGDHCSPISDTTILSSLASDCNHIDHVRTQMPYALTVGTISLGCVLISSFTTTIAWTAIISITISLGVLYIIIQRFGQTT